MELELVLKYTIRLPQHAAIIHLNPRGALSFPPHRWTLYRRRRSTGDDDDDNNNYSHHCTPPHNPTQSILIL